MTLTVTVAVEALVMIDCLIPGLMNIEAPIANRAGMTEKAAAAAAAVVVVAATVQRVEIDKHREIHATVEAELLPAQMILIMLPDMKRSMAGTKTAMTIVTDVCRRTRMGVVPDTVTRVP